MHHKSPDSDERTAISRREFFKQVSNLGLATASLPLALKVFLDFNQKIWAEDKNSKSVSKLIEAQYYEKLDDNKIKCTLCPNFHIYGPGERSFCFTRVNHKGVLMSHAYNNPCTISVDPIEKGPFNHFLPNTNSLAIAIGGCNLRCLYCQNWQFSTKGPAETKNLDLLDPQETLAQAQAKKVGGVAFTYTEPVCAPEFIGEFAAYCGSKFAVGVASGTDAIHLALLAFPVFGQGKQCRGHRPYLQQFSGVVLTTVCIDYQKADTIYSQ